MDVGQELEIRWLDEKEWRQVRFEGYDRGFMVFTTLISSEKMVARPSSIEVSDISKDSRQ